MVACVHQDWIDRYKDKAMLEKNDQPLRPPSLLDRQIGRDTLPNKGDVFMNYIHAPQTSSESIERHILDYWDKPTAPKQLKQMAYDRISIPATSCEIERVFSATGRLIQPRMAALKDDTIELRQCLQSWTRGGHIELQYI